MNDFRPVVVLISGILSAFLAIGIVALAIATGARGQESDWPANQFKRHGRWSGGADDQRRWHDREHHGWRHVPGRGWYHAEYGWHPGKRQYQRPRYLHRDPQCLYRAWTVPGRFAYKQKTARSHAVTAWQHQIAYSAGGRYAFIEHAKDAKYVCGPIGVEPVIKSVLWQCAVTATPCLPAPEKAAPVNGFFGTADKAKTDEQQKVDD